MTATWSIAPFDPNAAGICESLRQKRIRIGSQDLKIASIALARDAQFLSANLRDFQLVPALRAEDWLRP